MFEAEAAGPLKICTALLVYGDLWLQSQLLSWEGKGKMQLEVTEDDVVVEIRQN